MKIRRFRKLHNIKRHRHHPVIHHIHKKHKISYKTLFYMKEYGTKSHAVATIIKESIKIIIIASVISSFGGVGLENVKEKFIAIIPLLIMLPALNDMIGDFGTIVSSKFTSMIYTGKINLKKGIMQSADFRKLVRNVFCVALISSLYLSIASYLLAYYKGFAFNAVILAKIIGVAVLCTLVLVSVIFITSVISGLYIYRKKEDPNNFLIPIATSLADLGAMLLFAFVVVRLF
ncbi:MAG: magnesium transporter [Candidatus Aenigmarchaeota archaeon]|nr:magnesium transporter [Candidatus Aenigmarchaeota archaeon]MDI6722705.1 magnesium transporter [Candidatus Aenigmarchaeota archaeon]